jgi:uncharacterized membrane protein YkvA (DUF1232 family)
MRTVIAMLKRRAAELRAELTALYYASSHPRVGFFPRFWIALALGYALSPIDLIPDFIPILGYLDDLIIVPLFISFAVRAIPKDVMEENRERARREPVKLGKNPVAAVIIVLVWLSIAFFVARAVLGMIRR